ncbi:MAG: RES family NAD+ phosphorylase [Actinomycetota bacterium]|nr:RES family NAD+ phosphorylase [Actinomycetota bacterium]
MPPADRGLIQIVDGLPRIRFEREAFRHVAPGYQPRGGEGVRIQGGRWNPPDSFPVLYLALERESVVGEFYRRARREGSPPENLLPRLLYRFRVELRDVLDLREDSAMEALGLTQAILTSDDAGSCQAVGDAAHYAGFEALLAPSATGIGHTLAVFTDRLRAGSFLEPLDHETWETLPPLPWSEAR